MVLTSHARCRKILETTFEQLLLCRSIQEEVIVPIIITLARRITGLPSPQSVMEIMNSSIEDNILLKGSLAYLLQGRLSVLKIEDH